MNACQPSVTLDGEQITLRPTGPGDEQPMTRYFEELSPESRRLRFHQPVPIVKPWLIRPLVDVDHTVHVAWTAWSGARIVGEARYVRLRSDPTSAEIAFSVADTHRRRGIGTLMVESLGELARADGVEAFTSMVGHDNRASSAFLTGLGTRFSFADGALEGRAPVPAWSRSSELAACLVRCHRAIAPQLMEVAA